MHPLSIAGFLSALALAHATVAAYSFVLYARPTKPARPSADPELVVFGVLNAGIVMLDAGLARMYALAGAPMAADLGGALLVVDAARIAALAFLLHFVVRYAGERKPLWTVPAIYGAAGVLEIANALGAFRRLSDTHLEKAWIAGAGVPVVRAPTTALGWSFAIAAAIAALVALAILAQAFVRGRREAIGFVGITLLAVTVVHDALRGVGWAPGPPIEPFGYAAFVNGVILTLLSRFSSLRGQLEERARDLKVRARDLAGAYEELRAAQDELVRKEQLAAVGELSAVVAHEVRNPLAIISNAVATLRRSGIGPEDRETLLGILDEESSRLNRLVGDLLRFARPINLERQHVSLRDLVERGMGLAEGKVDLYVELVEPEPTEKIWADANLVRQVIENLIDNAIQAMQTGGVLTITLINLELEGSRGVEIQIQDTGEGMDTQVRARALDPFFTTRPSGTGLGLAIVARIIDAHGGVLRIRSKSGAGTVMHVFLPLSAEPAPRLRDRPSSDPPLPNELREAIGRSHRL